MTNRINVALLLGKSVGMMSVRMMGWAISLASAQYPCSMQLGQVMETLSYQSQSRRRKR